MKEELISVITAVYNAQDYLEDCINSVLSQTYKNIEYLLIDDGSTDNSSEICKKYAKKDKRVKYIYQENGGPSAAQNKGIDSATGKYICFVDNDDAINKKTLEILYRELKDNDADLSMALAKDILDYDESLLSDEIKYSKDDLRFYNSMEMLENATKTDFIRSYPKLYKKELFNDVKFMVGMVFDDVQLVPHLYDQLDKVVYIPVYLYYRLIRDNSIVHSKFKQNRFQIIDASLDRIEYYKSRGYDNLLPGAYEFLISNNIVLYKLAVLGDAYKEDIDRIISMYRSNYKKYKKYLSLTKRIKYFIFYCLPKLSLKIFLKTNKEYK